MSSTENRMTVADLAKFFGQSVLRIAAVLEAWDVPFDLDTGEIDSAAAWRKVEQEADRCASEKRKREKAVRKKANTDPARTPGSEPREPSGSSDAPDLETLFRLYPDSFPRAKDASPEDRERLLKLDYLALLEARQDLFDEYATHEGLRKGIRGAFEDKGLNCRRQGREGMIFLLSDPRRPGWESKCATYVILKKNRFNQVFFVVRHLDDPSIEWVLLVARPLRRTYLFRTSELRERAQERKPGTSVKSMGFSIRGGSHDGHLFENRVQELWLDTENSSAGDGPGGQR